MDLENPLGYRETKAIQCRYWRNGALNKRLLELEELLSSEQKIAINQESLDVCYDRNFFDATGLDYNNPNEPLIRCVLAEEMLQNAKEEKNKP